MKKLRSLLVFLTIFLFFSGNALAAWTYSQEWLYRVTDNGSKLLQAAGIKITCTSDGADPAANAIENLPVLLGMYLLYAVTAPGAGATAPDETFDVSFTDVSTHEILLLDDHSNSATDDTPGNNKMGVYPQVGTTLNYNFDDIGSSGDIVYLYLYFGR